MNFHTPVLLNEIIRFLNTKPNNWYIDATLGGGGHTEEILKKGGKVIGIDQDKNAINEVASKFNLKRQNTHDRNSFVSDNLILVQDNFTNLSSIITSVNQTIHNQNFKIYGILFDLGVSSYQLDNPQRGFSFLKEAPLDMRMNPTFGATAADLVNGLHEGELARLFEKLGEKRYFKIIAKKIVEVRKNKKIETTTHLAQLVKSLVPKSKTKIHPATRVFQALRIAVNDELGNLENALPQALGILESSDLSSQRTRGPTNQGGRLVVISFHSLEDRIVKNYFRDWEKEGKVKILTKKPIIPSEQEISQNPRARSAKLRAIKIL